MRTFTLLASVLMISLTGCRTSEPQRITVGVRLSAPSPIKGRHHRAAKIPLDLTVEYEIGGERKQLESCDDE